MVVILLILYHVVSPELIGAIEVSDLFEYLEQECKVGEDVQQHEIIHTIDEHIGLCYAHYLHHHFSGLAHWIQIENIVQ